MKAAPVAAALSFFMILVAVTYAQNWDGMSLRVGTNMVARALQRCRRGYVPTYLLGGGID